MAGREAGRLTESGAALLDPTGTLEPGIPLCPPEGDAGTGMVATDSVRPRTGNVSAGTSAQGYMDEAGVISHNFLSGDALVHLPAGRPLTMRRPGSALPWPATCCGGAVGRWRTTWTGRSSPTPGP